MYIQIFTNSLITYSITHEAALTALMLPVLYRESFETTPKIHCCITKLALP